MARVVTCLWCLVIAAIAIVCCAVIAAKFVGHPREILEPGVVRLVVDDLLIRLGGNRCSPYSPIGDRTGTNHCYSIAARVYNICDRGADADRRREIVAYGQETQQQAGVERTVFRGLFVFAIQT